MLASPPENPATLERTTMPHPLGYTNPIRTHLYRGAIERCQGTNQSGTRCGHRPKWARDGLVLCGQHVALRPPKHAEATEVIEEEYR